MALIIFATVPNNFTQFRILDCMIIGIGLFSSTFYMFVIREVPLAKQAKSLEKEFKDAKNASLPEHLRLVEQNKANAAANPSNQKTWRDWIGNGNFYLHGMVYMLARIAVNVTMVRNSFHLIYIYSRSSLST
jgi:Na+/melibiose symporter-like transporter